MDQLSEENAPLAQGKAPSPLGGGSGVNGTVDMNALVARDIEESHEQHDYEKDHGPDHLRPAQHEVAEAPEGEPKALAEFLRGWLARYRVQCGIDVGNDLSHVQMGPQLGSGVSGSHESVPKGYVHEGAGLGADSGLLVSHVLPPDFSASDCDKRDGKIR